MPVALIVISLVVASGGQAPPGRLRPPDALTCDRNQLTSFSGEVVQWFRDEAEARITLDTDAETRETFSVRFERGSAPERLFLLGGNTFRAEDWAKVESSRGRIRPGMRATVWVCEGGATPVIDWRLPPK